MGVFPEEFSVGSVDRVEHMALPTSMGITQSTAGLNRTERWRKDEFVLWLTACTGVLIFGPQCSWFSDLQTRVSISASLAFRP